MEQNQKQEISQGQDEAELQPELKKVPLYLTKSNPFLNDYLKCQTKNVGACGLALLLAGASVILIQEMCNVGKFIKRGPKLFILPSVLGLWTAKALMTTNSNLCHEDMEILYEKHGMKPLTGVDWRVPSNKYPNYEVGLDGKPFRDI